MAILALNILLICLAMIGAVSICKLLLACSRIVLRYLQGDTNTKKALRLLCSIYKPWAVCLVRVAEYVPEKGFLRAVMHAPKDYSYTWIRPECVTGIHYDVSVSELNYVFISFLIRDEVASLMTDQEFERLKKFAAEMIALKELFDKKKREKDFTGNTEKKREWKEGLVRIRKDLRNKRADFADLLWRNPKEAEEAYFSKLDKFSRWFVRGVYNLKNWLEGLVWRPFSPEGILSLNRRQLEALLFERLMEKYKLVFLSKDIAYLKRISLGEDFEFTLELSKHTRTKTGFPLTIVKVGGGVVIGIVKNAALMNEIKE